MYDVVVSVVLLVRFMTLLLPLAIRLLQRGNAYEKRNRSRRAVTYALIVASLVSVMIFPLRIMSPKEARGSVVAVIPLRG